MRDERNDLIRVGDALDAITDWLCEEELRHGIEPSRRVNNFFAKVMLEKVPRTGATADTPQTERIKTPDYCDICNHKGCDNCTANNLDDYCVPSGYAPKDTPQTDCDTCRHYKLACELFSEICKYEPTTQTETQNSNLTFDAPQTDVYDYKGNGKWERSE